MKRGYGKALTKYKPFCGTNCRGEASKVTEYRYPKEVSHEK